MVTLRSFPELVTAGWEHRLSYQLGRLQNDLALADLNGDGALDVIAAHAGSSYGDVAVALHTQGWQVRHYIGASPVTSLRIQFPGDMDRSSFQLTDDVVSFTGPQGAVGITGFQWLNDSTLAFAFAPQSIAGHYRLVLGAHVTDASGREVDLTETESGVNRAGSVSSGVHGFGPPSARGRDDR